VARQRAVYEGYAQRAARFGEDQTIAADEPAVLAEQLAQVANDVGADALDLRVQLPGVRPEEVRDQIAAIGETVVGLAKQLWSSRYGRA
jgi:hypothetical protein